MKCLCCGKILTQSKSESEQKWQWHKKCIKKFFHTEKMPVLDITKDQLEVLVNKTVKEGLTVPGVQKKLSLHLSSDLQARLPGNREFQLSKAYDMLPVNVIIPEDKEQLALTINGKKRNIHKKEFRLFAESCEIPPNAAKRMTEKICSMERKLLNQVEAAYLTEEHKEKVKKLISERIEILM